MLFFNLPSANIINDVDNDKTGARIRQGRTQDHMLHIMFIKTSSGKASIKNTSCGHVIKRGGGGQPPLHN